VKKFLEKEYNTRTQEEANEFLKYIKQNEFFKDRNLREKDLYDLAL